MALLSPANASASREKGQAKLAFYFSQKWLRCLVLFTLGTVVHLPALSGQFLWDDLYLAQDNPMTRSPLLILEAFRHYLFVESYSGHYRPVQTVSYIFDYWFSNNNSYGYHLTNMLCHCLGGVLLYLLLVRILRPLLPSTAARLRGWIAFGIAALWIVHPVHSAAVDYISGRADSLAFVFGCTAWLSYLRAARERRLGFRRLYYCLAGLSAILCLCSRESGGLWLLLFSIYLFAFEKRVAVRSKLLTFAVVLTIGGFYLGLRHLPESRLENPEPENWTASTHAMLMLRALGDYARLMLFPSNLHMERSVFQPASYLSIAGWRRSIASEYLSLAGIATLMIFVGGALRRGSGQRLRLFGALWFLLSYLPTSNLLDLGATVAEHWLYLPSVGFIIFLAGCALDFPQRTQRQIAAVGCLCIVVLSVRSAIRSSDWVDPLTFFQRTLAAGGSSTRVAVNLASLYLEHGENQKAETLFRRVLQSDPNHPIARNNLGAALIRLGKSDEAAAIFDQAQKVAPIERDFYPRTWRAACNLAALRHEQKDDAGALALLERTRRDYPDIWPLISLQAEIRREHEGPRAALATVEEFARAHWWHAGASLALGRLLSELGENDRAEAAFGHAGWLDIHAAEAFDLIAALRLREGDLAGACEAQRRAVARQPDDPRQYILLAGILRHLKREPEADRALARSHELERMARITLAKN